MSHVLGIKSKLVGVPGWLSWLSVCLGSGHELRVLGSSLMSGSLLSGESASPSPSVLPSRNAPTPAPLVLSLSNK